MRRYFVLMKKCDNTKHISPTKVAAINRNAVSF